jgi:hypothetical protein
VALGVPGAVLAFTALAGAHTMMAHNANIFFTNPLALLAIPLGVACIAGRPGAASWLRRTWLSCAMIALAGAIALRITAFGQDNAWVVALALPLIGGIAASIRIALPGARRATTAQKTFVIPLTTGEQGVETQ